MPFQIYYYVKFYEKMLEIPWSEIVKKWYQNVKMQEKKFKSESIN